jgi:hypothetical protein
VYRCGVSTTSIQEKWLVCSIFFNEFPILIENLAGLPGRLLVVGDFNFHLDVSTNRDAILFLDLLDSNNLIQHVETPTHNRGHLLDLVITRNSDTVISDIYKLIIAASLRSCCNYWSNLCSPP